MKTKFEDVERQDICDLAHQTLMSEDTDDVTETLAYLTEQRRLTKNVLEEFKFGYIPKRVGHDWAERIIMPLHNHAGELVVLTSRKYRTNDKDQRPHLHEQFDKKRYLFGLDVAKKHILEKNAVVIVEGQFDTCLLHSMGMKNVVGVLGSAFTFDHACQLRRYCTDMYLSFDRDKAGCENVIRAMDMWDKKSLSIFDIRFIPVKLPRGVKDPDDFVKEHGLREYGKLLGQARDNADCYMKEDWNVVTTKATS